MPDFDLEWITRVFPENYPPEMKEAPFWVIWQAAEFYPPQPQGHTGNWTPPRKILKNPVGFSWQKKRVLFKDLPALQKAQGYGFLYTEEHPYICVDIDLLTNTNDQLVRILNSLTFWSPSGKGGHVIIETNDKTKIIEHFGSGKRDKKEGRDLFISSGFVTITGDLVPCFEFNTRIRAIPYEHLIEILDPFFSNKIIDHPKVTAKAETYRDWDERKPEYEFTHQQIILMLKKIPVKYLPDNAFTDFPKLDFTQEPESRDAWLKVGSALHNYHEGALNGYFIWKEWSEEGNKYDEKTLDTTWKSFKTTVEKPITMASVLKLVQAQSVKFVDFSKKGHVVDTWANVDALVKYHGFTFSRHVYTTATKMYLPSHLREKYPDAYPSTEDADFIVQLINSEAILEGMLRSLPIIRAYVKQQADKTMYSPIADYFDNLANKWDKHDYLQDLFDTIIFDDEMEPYKPYLKTMLQKWLIQIAAAAYTSLEKPHRLNTVLIFSGPQGIGKTQWVESLFPKELLQYCVGSKTLQLSIFKSDTVKSYMELMSTLICNINEIDTLFRPNTFSDFKAFLDQTVDRIVLPYGREPTQMTRNTVFAGSTNQIEFLADATGNRRFFIFFVKFLDHLHKINITQLWAQVRHLYQSGQKWWLQESIPYEQEILNWQKEINTDTMEIEFPMIIDKLNAYYDTDAPYGKRWTSISNFTGVANLLGLSYTVNSAQQKSYRKTVALWLSKLKHGPKPNPRPPTRKRGPWTYYLPPMREE